MTELKIIGRTGEGIIIKPLSEKEYTAIPEMIKVDSKVTKIKGDIVTSKILNYSEFYKAIEGIKKEPKGYKIIYTDCPDKIVIGSKITQFVKITY